MEDPEQNKLFVGGISWETTEHILNDHFDKYGAVLSSVVAKDRISNHPRGFAFVTFSESSAVDRALRDSHQILSRKVEVKRAIPRSKQRIQQQQHTRGLTMNSSRTNGSRTHYDGLRTKKIFVGGLSANLTEDEFRSYFETFGRINDVVVMHDNMTHRPRGFGFITFDSEDSVEAVMQKNFHELTGKLVEVKQAVPKDGSSNGKGSNFNYSYEQENHTPYNNSRFGYYPSGYGTAAGHPYGAGLFGGQYGAGIGYGLAPFGQRSPWPPAIIGVRGCFLPYGYGSGATPFYPAYVNGGPGVMGLAGNGYSGILGGGSTPSVGTNIVDTNSFCSGRGFGAEANGQGRKVGNAKSFQATNSS